MLPPGRGGVPGPHLAVLAGAAHAVPLPEGPPDHGRRTEMDTGSFSRAARVPRDPRPRRQARPGASAAHATGAAVPRPTEAGRRYVPALDGVRALAVLLVLAYHLRLPMVPGGLLGVGIFFTLSGYLITDLLLAQWDARGRVKLRRLLDPSGPAVAARRVRRSGGRRGVGAVVRPLPVVLARRRDRRRLRLRQQLVGHRAERLVLLPLRAAVAAGPSVVAGDRGAVLPDLAVAAPARRAGRAQPLPAGRPDPRRGGRVRAGHGRPVHPRSGPDAGLRRHRHPRFRPADRRSRSHGRTHPAAARLGHPDGAEPPRRRRARRTRRHRLCSSTPRRSTRRSCSVAGWCCCRWPPRRWSSRCRTRTAGWRGC